jgi:RNA polymerase primary sigma factor
MKIAPEKIEDLEILDGKDISLSSKYFDENIEMGDKLKDDITPSVEYQIIKNSIEQQIRNLLDKLDEKEAIVIRLRFGLDDDRPRTLQEIGDKLKLTRERIRQIEQRAMRKLSRSHKLQQLKGYLN